MSKLPQKVSEEEADDLVEEAEKVRPNTFSTFTESSVGAAILTDSGDIHAAPYFESVIQGLGTCAERNAVGSAVAAGDYKFKAVAVVGQQEEPITPCGACRQILAEFKEIAQHDIAIIMEGQNGDRQVEMLSDMIPESFGGRRSRSRPGTVQVKEKLATCTGVLRKTVAPETIGY